MLGEIDGHRHPFTREHIAAFERELMRHGAVHLRGFSAVDLDLIAHTCAVRPPDASAGTNPHALLHYGPFCPDLSIWSGDDVPAMLVDGVDLYRALGGQSRRRLAAAKLTFRVETGSLWLEAALGSSLENIQTRWFDGRSISTGGVVRYEHETCALSDTDFGPAVANGMLAAMTYRSIDTDRASRIAPSLDRHTLWEMMDAAFELSSEIDWCPGDVLITDNRRTMVGFAPTRARLACHLGWRPAVAVDLARAA